MRIAVLDGSPPGYDPNFETCLSDICKAWTDLGHGVDHLKLRDLDLRWCSGCWSCWVRTPGRCSRRDDGDRVLTRYMASDLVLLASPLVQGFISARLKNMVDRLIPLFHPHIELRDGECTHGARYEKMPALASLLGPGPRDTVDDLVVVEAWLRRTAYHFQSRFAFARRVGDDLDEIIGEVRSLGGER